MGGPSATILHQRVVYVQYVSNPYKLSASRLKCPTILSKTTLTSLIVLNPREDPLAQAIVPRNNLVSYLYIIHYFTSTDFAQSLVLQQEVVVATLAKMAFTEHPPKLLVNFIYRVQKRDAFIRFIYNQLTQGESLRVIRIIPLIIKDF